jgi:hypothetical protein
MNWGTFKKNARLARVKGLFSVVPEMAEIARYNHKRPGVTFLWCPHTAEIPSSNK